MRDQLNEAEREREVLRLELNEAQKQLDNAVRDAVFSKSQFDQLEHQQKQVNSQLEDMQRQAKSYVEMTQKETSKVAEVRKHRAVALKSGPLRWRSC